MKGKGKAKGKDGICGKFSGGWAVSDEIFDTVLGPSGSAIVGGGMPRAAVASSSGTNVPPPPPVPVSWGARQPNHPPMIVKKARPTTPEPKQEPSEVKIEDLDGEFDGEAVPMEITVSPEPPPLGSEERPLFVEAVREWLLNNFTKSEYEFIVH